MLCTLRMSKSARVNLRPIRFSVQPMQSKCFIGILAWQLF